MVDLKEYILEDGSKIKTMNLDNYYLHATGSYEGFDNNYNAILTILQEGKLKTRADRNIELIGASCNLDNEICLCDLKKKKPKDRSLTSHLVSSFSRFIERSPALVFRKEFSVFSPQLMRKGGYWSKQKCTDLYDEVRCIGSISLKHLEFLTFPIWPIEYTPNCDKNDIDTDNKLTNLYIFFNNIKSIEKEFKTVKIKDLYTGMDLTSSYVEQQIKIYQKKVDL